MKFHFNEIALRHIAQSRLPDREGRLQYRSSKGGYKERWFRLQGNLLFYFRTNEFGSIADHDPLGVFVLAQFSVELEPIADRPFVFSIAFAGEEGKKHYFSGQTMQQCHDWLDALQRNSYEAVQMKFECLRKEVQRLTGKDPLTEKMAISIKQRAKLCVAIPSDVGQESRRTKFYYSDGSAAKSAPKEKPVHPSEALNTKLVHPYDSNSAPSSQQKPLLEEVLVSLSVEDSSVQKNSIQPSITQMSQVRVDMSKMPSVPQGMSEMPLVQWDVSKLLPSQSIQLSNNSQMPGMFRMPLGQPVISQMPVMRPGISHVPTVQPGISQMPLLQSSISQVPVAQSATAQMRLFQPGITQMPVAQLGISQLPNAQSGISKIPLEQPDILQTPLVPLSEMPAVQHGTTSMLAKQMSTMQMPLTMRPRSAETNNSSSTQKPQKSSFDESQTLQRHKHHNSETNTVDCWPLQPLQWTGKTHNTPELMSFQKWEKFDD